MVTPTRTVRIQPELEADARSHPGLADVSPSCLVRVALRVLGDLDDLGIPIASLRGLYGDRSSRLTAYTRPALNSDELKS